MTDTDLILISNLDQPILDDDEEQIRNLIRSKINESAEKKDGNIALSVIRQLVKITKLGGISLAEALYLTKKNWEIYGIEDDFVDVVFAYSGLHRHTVDRYVQVYEQLFVNPNIPEQLIDDVRNRNIRDLIPIAKALKQGYEIEDDQWEKLADAPDFNTVSQIIREDVKHKEPRKSGLFIFMSRDGSLYVVKEGIRAEIGHFNLSTKNSVVESAIERLVKNAGILLT